MPETFTVTQLIDRTQRLLLGTFRPERNRLTNSIITSDVTLTFDFDLGGIVPGATIGIDDELFYVWDAIPGSRTASVLRADAGTVAAAHTAGASVWVNSRFHRPFVLDHLRDEVRSWPPSLFVPTPVTLALPANERAVDLGVPLGTKVYDLLDVRVSPSGHEVGATSSWRQVSAPNLRRGEDPTFFPSGLALVIGEAFSTARSLRVVYGKPCDTSTWADSTDVEAGGVPSEALDVAAYGAAWRLAGAEEMIRNDPTQQGEPRRGEEVPAGALLRAAAWFKQMRDQRLSEEAERLRVFWRARRGA